MTPSAAHAKLRQIPVEKIHRNPDNPRVVFRPGEMEGLLSSIRMYGVQVPISVYEERKHFVLIDGERRWRCASKLNHKTIPALIQEKPQPLENLLLMFNIHALREQWDLLTIALKLPKVIALAKQKAGRDPTEAQLVEQTGLTRSVLRRCRLLMGLPDQYKDEILEELNKPKAQQRITEDLFIELERALTTVDRALPGLIIDRDKVRRILIEKYKKNIIKNRVHFRQVAKIARAKRVNYDVESARKELRKLFEKNTYSIEAAYENSVGEAYLERDIGTRVTSLVGLLEHIEASEVDDELRKSLMELYEELGRIIGE